MSVRVNLISCLLCLSLSVSTVFAGNPEPGLKKIAVVSSYHPQYEWSQGTNEGLMQGFLEFGILDNAQQAKEFTEKSLVRSSKAEIHKFWMHTKQKGSQAEIAQTLQTITRQIDFLQPDILLLGDDNAANYLGNYYLDTDLPVVFWGVNGTPLKYGLIDSFANSGHNVTGIYQKNYHAEILEMLLKLYPEISRVAILSDDSPTGRSHAKAFQKAIQDQFSQITLVESVITNNFHLWKNKALELEQQVDAFLISSNHTLKRDKEDIVDGDEVLRWYLSNIRKPEAVAQINYVRSGMLATVFDSPIAQGFETARLTDEILNKNRHPGDIAPYAPKHGGYIINRWRASQVGLADISDDGHVQFHEIIDKHIELN